MDLAGSQLWDVPANEFFEDKHSFVCTLYFWNKPCFQLRKWAKSLNAQTHCRRRVIEKVCTRDREH